MFILLLSQLMLLVFAREINEFINPLADNRTTTNDVATFAGGTTQTIQWTTSFKEASLALLPVNADPLSARDTAEFITRNSTVKSVEWLVAPPVGSSPGMYFFQIYQEGRGTQSFRSHTFTINAVVISSTITTITTPPLENPATSTAFPPAIQSINFIPSSNLVPTTAPLALASTSSLAVLPALTISTTMLTSSIPLSVFTRPKIPNLGTAILSASPPFSTSNTTSSPSSLTGTQNQSTTTSEKLSTITKIIAITIPIIIILAAISAFLTYRFISSSRGVTAVMKKSMKVQEMPQDSFNSEFTKLNKWRGLFGSKVV